MSSVICVMNIEVYHFNENEFKKLLNKKENDEIFFKYDIDDLIFVYDDKLCYYDGIPDNYFILQKYLKAFYCIPCDDLLSEEISNSSMIDFLEGCEKELLALPHFENDNINRGEYLVFELDYYQSFTDCGYEYDMDINYLGLIENIIKRS